MTEEKEKIETKLMRLTSSDYHESIGIYPQWRIGDKAGELNEIYPFYDSDQCEKIMDEVLGVDGWSNEYREVAGKLFCVVTIYPDNDRVIDRSDAGGARETRKKNLSEVEKATFYAKTAASDAFVRACSKLGVGRHLKELPKVRLKVSGGVAYAKNDKGEEVQLRTPQEISSYCNSTSPAMKYLIGVYQLHKASIEKNKEAMAAFGVIRKLIEGGYNE
jgi:hypothetical protein